MDTRKVQDTGQYIASFPAEVQAVLQQMRELIKEAAPGAKETISYGIPTYVLEGALVHFGGFKNHVGFYATPTGHEAFAKELSAYKQGRGSVQFPLDEPLPEDLIKRIVTFRVRQNLEKTAAKKKK